jgi:hypothetical protein
MLPFGLTPELTDQWECPAADGKVSAIVLDATHLLERIFIEGGFVQHASPIHTEQTGAAIVAEHVRMHAGKVGGNSEREKRGFPDRHAYECQCGIHTEHERRHDRLRMDAGLGSGFPLARVLCFSTRRGR